MYFFIVRHGFTYTKKDMDLLGGSRRGKMGTRIYLFLVGKMGLHACTGTGIQQQ